MRFLICSVSWTVDTSVVLVWLITSIWQLVNILYPWKMIELLIQSQFCNSVSLDILALEPRFTHIEIGVKLFGSSPDSSNRQSLKKQANFHISSELQYQAMGLLWSGLDRIPGMTATKDLLFFQIWNFFWLCLRVGWSDGNIGWLDGNSGWSDSNIGWSDGCNSGALGGKMGGGEGTLKVQCAMQFGHSLFVN